MTPLPDRLRTAALTLPEAEETAGEDGPTFLVAGEVFARYTGGVLRVRAARADAAEGFAAAGGDEQGWIAVELGDDVDWALVEDRIARSWELAAPRRLLEAGGR